MAVLITTFAFVLLNLVVSRYGVDSRSPGDWQPMHTYFIHPDDALRMTNQHIQELHATARKAELVRSVAPRRSTQFMRRFRSPHRLAAAVNANSLTCDVPCITGT